MYKSISLIIILINVLLFSSCGTHKKMVYFQTDQTDSTAVENSQYTPTFKPDDFLAIVVTANDPNSVVPFNFPVSGNTQPAQAGYSSGAPARTGYLVDPNGFVNLPILGKIKLGGLNRTEATDLLEEKMSAFLQSPVVNIQIQNYKVTVLGDVKKPGTYTIPNERISILEAIGLSGDLDITGVRNNVLVIRDENGEKKQYRVDLTTDQVLTSPVFYLEQNDVVYVEPNNAKRSQGTFWRSSGGIIISLTSLVITTITLITN
ncbi:sugar transporter [Brumimicrobium oceani]|uniref:Sugar transporter n=2 Tax=Brumimicrobium oceani TaxID=2100725 RepID=A0A2U2XEM4_9FLAO|nr:sugar transporter [Brumimicrobium oceani]